MDEPTYMGIHGIRFIVGFALFLVYIIPIANFNIATETSETWIFAIIL